MSVEGIEAPEAIGFRVERALSLEEDGVETVLMVVFEVTTYMKDHDDCKGHSAGLPIALPLQIAADLGIRLIAQKLLADGWTAEQLQDRLGEVMKGELGEDSG